MKLMIASDLHGSAHYTRQMLDRLRAEGADKLLLLGDILYHGPRNALPQDYDPQQVAAMLNAAKAKLLCIRGNCDAEVDQMLLEFPILSDTCILYIEGRMVYATHGHQYNEAHLPPLQPGDILLHGHTHVPGYVQHENYLYLNPGSVSIPKENSVHGYMIYENGSFLWKDLDGGVVQEYRLPQQRDA